MCGIVGYWARGTGADAVLAERMALRLQSRGPDDAGVWVDHSEGLALAHRRLAVLDLSPAGFQPMSSPCGNFVLTYNGEIYNHVELRRELEAEGEKVHWRGHSDTETLLAALRHWGVHKTLERLNGMFAFAFWDAKDRTLCLARDRMGEKPLYYGHTGEVFLFASELKALTAHPNWQGVIDTNAIALYLRHSAVPGPWSIYRGISKVPPAHYIMVQEGGRLVGEPKCYWDLGRVAEAGVTTPATGSRELTDELESLLSDAVSLRMAADVPLGAFLSGGYDSTIVVALMQAQANRPVKTFTVGCHVAGYDEAAHARAVAAHLGTDHTELYVTPEQAMAVVSDLPRIYDEPFGDSSQIPTCLVSRLARDHVTVSLSGDGGDELFGGYNRHIAGPSIWKFANSLPLALRSGIGSGIGLLSQLDIERLFHYLPSRWRIPLATNKLEKLASALRSRDGLAFYRDLVSHWKMPGNVVLGSIEPRTLLSAPMQLPNLNELCEQMMYLDQMTYLPDDILTKVDRASMAVSLEARVPMLDHRLVEFAWRVPTRLKVRDGKGKWLLREVLNRYVPRSLMDRPKMGFAVPIDHWLRGPLRGWAEELLNEHRLRREGFFDPLAVQTVWRKYLAGNGGMAYQLWDVLMFQSWLEAQR
jgi:asparagine synthase (glutamine-hydrolysing)